MALVMSMLWWAWVLASRLALMPAPPAALPPSWAHAWLMVYGIFPFFVLGFLMTAFVRWIDAPSLSPRLYRPVAFALFAGYVLAVLGSLTSTAVAATGMAMTAAAWLAGLGALALCLRAHPAGSPQPPWALVVLALGWLGAALAAWGAATGNGQLLSDGPRIGLWAFLLPMVFVVAHRMLPFFAQGALTGYTAFRPSWAPALVVVLFLLHSALMMTGHPEWLFISDGALAIVTGWLLWRWQPWRTRVQPLLWSLFVAFLWMPVGLALSAFDSASRYFGGVSMLGLAPLHVLAVGLLTSMVMAMVTRVSLGHSGRPLVMDRLSLCCFLILQLAVVARLAAELPNVFGDRSVWLLVSAGLWCMAVLPWAWRYGVIYWQPRLDGRAG